jgi:hypothetical protein
LAFVLWVGVELRLVGDCTVGAAICTFSRDLDQFSLFGRIGAVIPIPWFALRQGLLVGVHDIEPTALGAGKCNDD